MAPCGSNSCAPSAPPNVPTTPCCRNTAGAGAVRGDPTEGALIVAALKAGLENEALAARFPRVAEVPFSSERKLMSTIHSDAERRERLLVLTKGAPDILLVRCSHELVGENARPLTAERRADILSNNEELAGEALRTLGVAFRSLPNDASGREAFDEDIEQDLVFLGLIGMIDPPRDEARAAVAKARDAGIRTDHDYGRSPQDRRGHRRRARHHGRRQGRRRRRAREDVRRDARPDGAGRVGLCARQSRAQVADRQSAAARRDDGCDDGRRRQRRAGAEDRRHRRGDGRHRDRCFQGSRRHRARRRQFRDHRGGHRRRARRLLEHQEISALPALVEHRRGHDHVLRRGPRRGHRADRSGRRRSRAAAARHADPLDQPPDGRRAGARPRRRSGGSRNHE